MDCKLRVPFHCTPADITPYHQSWAKATTHKMPEAMIKQWEREQTRSKPRTKDASKTSANSDSITAGLIPTSTQPAISPPHLAAQNVQPTIQNVQPEALSTFPAVIQPNPVVTFPQLPTSVPNIQLHPQLNNGYTTSMFAHNTIPYNAFGPNSGFPNFSPYSQNPHQYYPVAGSYQPARNNHLPPSAPPYPILPGGNPFQPLMQHTFPEPHPGPDFPIYQPRVPTLGEWFATFDDHPERGMYKDEYAQYSHTFDLHGLKMLSDLEGLKPDQLFESFGISHSSAHRLLEFAEEDLSSIRARANTHRG